MIKKDGYSRARLGRIDTGHGSFSTPAFLPVGTQGTVKSLIPEELVQVGVEAILGNTYHLYLRPGHETIRRLGGLHTFMHWEKPILTDSGGYQIFSLAKLRKISEEGATFQSHLDGSRHLLTPEKVVEIQRTLGSDIAMVLDECIPYPSSYDYVKTSTSLTTRWARRSLKEKRENDPALFAIVQGGANAKLRAISAQQLIDIGFDGYALGGLAVGEPVKDMLKTLDAAVPHLPQDKPRYLMGVGYPEQIAEAVKRGIDMFDCVLPTRNARHGVLFTNLKLSKILKTSYNTIRIKQQKFAKDTKPLDPTCQCPTCQNYSKGYLRHLFSAQEPLALRLATIHNVNFYLRLMKQLRENI